MLITVVVHMNIKGLSLLKQAIAVLERASQSHTVGALLHEACNISIFDKKLVC